MFCPLPGMSSASLTCPLWGESSLSFCKQVRCCLLSAGLHTTLFQEGCAPLCAGPPKYFTLLITRNFGWLFMCPFGSLAGGLLKATDSVLFIFVSLVLAPSRHLKILGWIYLYNWAVLRDLTRAKFLSDLNKPQKRKHKFSKKKLLISPYVHSI